MSNEREEGYSDTSDSSNAHDDGTEPCICRHGRPLWGGDLATQANSDNFDSDNPDSNSVIPGGNSVIPAPEPESNNNPIQENKDWIAGQARNDGDVYIPFSEKVGSPAPVIQGERPFSIGALGVGEISTLDDLTPGVTVKYDSQNLSGDSDVIETPVFTSVNTPVVLEVAPVFTDVESNTKTLTITLAEGMAFTSLPGFTRSGSIWDDFSVSKLDSAIREWIVDATYEPATGISAMHPTSAGTVTYTFSAGTVQPGTLALYVAGDSGYVTMLNSALNITDAVTVVRSENGTSATADTVKLETYKVTGSTSQVRFDSNSHVIKNPGDTWEFDTSFYIQTNSTSGNTGDGGSKAHVFDTLIRTFAIPKYLNVNPVVEGSSGVDAGITSTLVSGADNTNYDYLQVTINGKTAKGRNLHFEGQVDDVLPEGIAGTNVIAIASVSSLLTYIQGGSTSQNGFLNPPEIQFTDPNSVGKLTFTPSAVDISANNINAPAVFTPLGTFGFQNLSGADIDNVRLHFDYDSTLVGVRAVRILTTDNSTASNIVITTTNDLREPIVIPGSAIGNKIFLAAGTDFTLSPGEYVKTFEYTIKKVAADARLAINYAAPADLQYFGDLLQSAATGGSYSMTVTQVGKDNTQEYPTTVNTETTNKTSYQQYSTLEAANNVVAGETITLNTGFGFRTSQNDGPLQRLTSTKGVVSYVRVPAGFELLPDSLQVTWDNKTWYLSDLVYSDDGEDNTGAQIYKFELPDVILGYVKQSGAKYSDVDIQVDMKPSLYASASTTALSDIFALDFMSALGVGINNDQTSVDKYNIAGQGTSHRLIFGVNNKSVSVIPQNGFLTSTAADRNDGRWKTYDGTPETIINLNTQLQARYQVSAINNIGSDITGSYDVIIPIPKAGETTTKIDTPSDLELQDAPFEWTAYLGGEVNIPNFTATYAVGSYERGFADSSAWKTWGEVGDPDDVWAVRLVRTTGAIIEKDATESYNIPFKLPTGTEAQANSWSGKTNIYRVLVNKNLTGSVGFARSLPVALCLKTGLAEGVVNVDGTPGGAGNMPAVATASAGGLLLEGTLVESTTVSSSTGVFQFTGLDTENNVDLTFTNTHPVVGGVVAANSLRFATAQSGLPNFDIASNQSTLKVTNLAPSSDIAKNLAVDLISPKTITFNTGTGASTVVSQYAFASDGVDDTTAPTDPTKLGYTFGGWFTDDGTFGNAWTFGADNIGSNKELFAKWTAKTVNLIFDENQGTFTGTKPADAKYDGTITEPEKEPTRSGYNFTGWKAGDIDAWDFTNETGTKVTVGNGVSGANGISPSLTLVAQWSDPIEYDITYNNLVGSSWSGDIHPDTYTVESNDITISKPTKTGYTFKGWTATGGITYAIPQETIVIPKGTTVAISLNAVWEVNTEDAYWNIVDFDDNGSDSGDITNELYVAPGKKISEAEKGSFPSDPTKDHYVFDGWKVDGTETKYADSDAAKNAEPEASITLVAQWKVNTADTIYWNTVAFDDNDSTSGAISDILYVAPDKKISEAEKGSFPSDPAKTHYIFDGWKVDGTNTKYADSAAAKDAVPTGDITLVAQWKVDTTNTEYWAKVSFNTNGGSTAPAPVYVSYGNADPALDGTWPSDPTRAGYTFSGWFDGESRYDDSTILTIEADTTVVAKWTIDEDATKPGTSDPVWATVSFNANGGTGAPSDILYNTTEKKLADGVSFPTAKPSLTGYTFANWNTKANGKGSIVTGESNLSTITGNTTLYAIWNANGNTDYKVEHYLVDASGSASLKETSNHTAKTDTTANATAKTYEHYTLNSAHSSAVASGNVSGDGSLVLKLYYGINHNVVSYSVTGTVPEGAPAAPAASDVAYGQTVNVAQALAFDGYTFSGWTADGVSGASFTMPDSDVAFTGSWTLIDNGGGDNGDTGGQNDGNDDENGNDDDDTVVDEPKEPKADTPKPATTNTKVTRTPAPATPATAQATIAAAAAEQGIPTFGIGGNEIPLVAPFGVDSWSLANMLFMLAALVFAIYTTIAVARRRKYVYEMGEDSSANPRYGLFAITIAMAIASVVLFFTTQDLTQGMALVDVVSPEFVVALAVNVIAAKKVLPKIDGSLI